MQMIKICFIRGMLAVALFARLAAAQIDSGVPDGRSALVAIKTAGGTSFIARTLRQAERPMSGPRLDEIADSLAAFAIRADPDEVNIDAVLAAIIALGLAGRSDGEGIPYVGAGVRLRRIAEVSRVGVSSVLHGMSRLSDRAEATALVRNYAIVEEGISIVAVGYLAETMGAEGRAALRESYERGEIRNERAYQRAEEAGRRFNWIAPPRRRVRDPAL